MTTVDSPLSSKARCTYPVQVEGVEGGGEPCGRTEAQHGHATGHPFTLTADPVEAQPVEAPDEVEVAPLPTPYDPGHPEPLPDDPEPLPADGTTHELDADGVPFVSVSYSRGDGIVVAMQWTGTEDHVTVEALLEVAAGGLQAMRDAAADDTATMRPAVQGEKLCVSRRSTGTRWGCERPEDHTGPHAAWIEGDGPVTW